MDNDYDSPNVGAQRQEVNQPADFKKQKTLVRKLAGKRPVTQRTTSTSAYTDNTVLPTATSNFPQRSSNQNYNQYTGNKVPVAKSRGNVNYNTYTSRTSKQPDYRAYSTTTVPTIFQKINNLTEVEQDSSNENAATPVFDVSKTYKNSYNFRIQANTFQPKQNVPKASYPSSTPAPAAHTESLRLPSTEYLQNIAQTYQQPAALINNQLQDTNRNTYQPQPSPYDQYKKTQTAGTQSAFANYNNEYQQYNNYRSPATYQTTAKVAQNPVSQQNTYYNSVSTAGRSQSTDQFSYQSYTTPVAYVQPNTTVFDYYKYYQTSTSSPTVTQKARTYYSPAPTFNYYQQTSSTPSPAKYDPYATFQKANEKYDDEEFLKTAPSSNLKPSDLNAIHNQKKQLYINATLKAAYNVDPPKNSFSFYQPVAASTVKPASSVSAAQTYQVASSHAAQTTQSKTPVSAQSPNQVPAKPSTSGSTAATKPSHDYDYAYYDNAGSSEYDQVDPVEEDFAKIKKVQKS